MKRLLAFLIIVLSSSLAWSQAAPISGQVVDVNGVPVPFAKVRVCSVTSSGNPCVSLAIVYQDYGLGTPIGNPISADQYGNYLAFVPALSAPNLYEVQVSNGVLPAWTYVVNGPGTGGAGCVTFACLISGTNTVAAMVIGTGASLSTSGAGTIQATSFSGNLSISNFNGGTGASSTTAWFGDGTWKAALTSFAAPSGSWPTWLVPTVTNSTTAPSLAVAASSIPNAALANASITVSGATCTLGSTCNAYPPDVTVSIGSFAIPANTCYGSPLSTTPATFSMPGVVTGMKVSAGDTGNPAAINGYGATAGLNIHSWASGTNQGSYIVCNTTASPITGGAITVVMGAQ